MKDQKFEFVRVFRCPLCFLNWEKNLKKDSLTIEDKKCDFCKKNKLTSLQLLHRQIEVLEKAQMSDFPKVIRHLIEHLHLY